MYIEQADVTESSNPVPRPYAEKMSSSGKAVIEKLYFVMKHANARKGFDKYLKDVSIVSAAPGKVDFEMEVKHEHTNQGGTLHGGMTSTLVDTMTTLALMSTEDGTPGLSLNLGINFLKTAKVGEKIRIEAEVIKQGRTIAHTTAKILNQKGDIVAVGSHVKHIGA